MKNVCSYCASELSSRVEVQIKTCINCFYKINESLSEEKSKREHAEKKLAETISTLELVTTKFDSLNEIVINVNAGEHASEKGLPESQNPHEKGSAKYSSWMCGWANNEAFRAAKQALSVIKWAIESLEVIRQIVKANDDRFGGDVSAKLETVISKLETIK
jgi:hypothetical protein